MLFAAPLAAGCKSDPPPPPQPIYVTITAPNAPAKIIRIQFDAGSIPLIDHEHWKLTLPPGSDPTTMASHFKVVLATTCGEESVEVVAVSPEGQLEGKWPVPAMLHVDNEGVGSAATVSVGSIVVDAATTKVLVGACATARDIRIDDAVVGQIGTSTIVDAKGGHCYEVMTNGYPTTRLESKRTYERAIDLFLPPEIPMDKISLRRCEGRSSGNSASLTELLGAPVAVPSHNAPVGAFTINPSSKSNLPPPTTTRPPGKAPKKPRNVY